MWETCLCQGRRSLALPQYCEFNKEKLGITALNRPYCQLAHLLHQYPKVAHTLHVRLHFLTNFPNPTIIISHHLYDTRDVSYRYIHVYTSASLFRTTCLSYSTASIQLNTASVLQASNTVHYNLNNPILVYIQ